MYSNVSKIVVDSKAGGNLLYLPLDKLISATADGGPAANGTGPSAAASSAAPASAPAATPAPTVATDTRARGNERSRSRDAEAR